MARGMVQPRGQHDGCVGGVRLGVLTSARGDWICI